MGKHLFALVAGLIFAFALVGAAVAETPDDAKTLVLKAAEELAHVGKAKAYAEFQEKGGAYWQGDLYVFVFNMEGIWEAYPPKPEAVGVSFLGIRDVDGKEFVKDMIEVAKTSGEGWVDYKWKNPITKKIQPKTSYIKRVGDVFLGVGVYK